MHNKVACEQIKKRIIRVQIMKIKLKLTNSKSILYFSKSLSSGVKGNIAVNAFMVSIVRNNIED